MERGKDGQPIVEQGASKEDVVYNFPSEDRQEQPAVELVDASTSTEIQDGSAATGSSASPAISAEVQTDTVNAEADDAAVTPIAQVEGIIEQSLALETISLPNLPQASPEFGHEGVAAELERVVEQGMRVQQGMAQNLPQPEAEELHRAVQSLQTRWNQMQDVVAGMQQMLRIIEESRALAGQLRNQSRATGANEETEENDNPDSRESSPPVEASQRHPAGASATNSSEGSAAFSNLWRSFIGAGTLGPDATNMARAWRDRAAAQQAQAATQGIPRSSETPSEILQHDSSSSDNVDGY